MIDRFFEYSINKLYWEYLKENDLSFGGFNPETTIKFGGFVLRGPYWNPKKERGEVERGWRDRKPLLKMGDILTYIRTILP